MVYTVTFNPSVDVFVTMDELRLGAVNRVQSEQVFFGGKGINVSYVLNELGVMSRVLGFAAGFTGKALSEWLGEQGISSGLIMLEKGFTRINLKVKSDRETEINGSGPNMDQTDIERLFDILGALSEGDIIVLAGSIPKSVPDDIYERILERLDGGGVRAVVDAEGRLLMNVLKYRPFLIKPNDIELGQMFDKKLSTADEIEYYARKLQEMGAQNVLVSRAGDGALLVDENGRVHTRGVCKGTVRNSVGAGDSMVAGFLAGYLETQNYSYALDLGTAAGGATAFSEGLAKRSFIDELLGAMGNA